MIVHSSLQGLRSCSKTGSSRINWRCFSSKNDKHIIMVPSSQTRRSFYPMVATSCNSYSMSLIGRSANAVIRASDTDVLVILLGMIERHLTSQGSTAYSCIIMDCGSVNRRRHIDFISLANALEAKQKGLAAAMPDLHAFTGSAFYRKGKIKPREVLENDTE